MMYMYMYYRSTLHALASRAKYHDRVQPDHTSHTNFRYLTSPQKIERLHYLKQQNIAAKYQIDKLKAKLANVTVSQGISLDANTTTDLHQIMMDEEKSAMHTFPEGSFQQIFWQQQMRAASKSGKEKKGMRWHPLIIKWCLYLRHQSSKCYETLRDSGCIHLPSQRTLRDYSNCVKAGAGFSTSVDMQLMQAAKIGVCPEWHKYVILLVDEMYIREGLVYNKYTGRMTGFVELGDVNNHLLAFEQSLKLEENGERGHVLAKSMVVMMVRGLFTPLKFAYAQFPCARMTGDMLFQPFWKAVYRLERMGLKVSRLQLFLMNRFV